MNTNNKHLHIIERGLDNYNGNYYENTFYLTYFKNIEGIKDTKKKETSTPQTLEDRVFYSFQYYTHEQGPDLIKPFVQLLNDLSYNLDFNSPNYRMGVRYFDETLNKFTWNTSGEDKLISFPKYNIDTKKYETAYKLALITAKMIFDHHLGCYSQNRKHKILNHFDEYTKEYLIDNLEIALKNCYKIDGKTFGTTQQLNSDILLIDIDNRSNITALETFEILLNLLDLYPEDVIYIEQNKYTFGIHTALKLPQKITNPDFYPKFEQYCKDNGIKIECNFINKILRFPLSSEYRAIKHDNNIVKCDEKIPLQFWEKSFESFIQSLNFNPVNSRVINDLIKETHKDSKKNYWKTPKHIVKKRNGKKIKKDISEANFITFGDGDRYDRFSKLIPYMKGLYQLSLDEIVEYIRQLDHGSKDLAKWDDEKLKKNITPFYNKCADSFFNHNTHSFTGFISNIKYIPGLMLKFLDSKEFQNYITPSVMDRYNKERRRHNKFWKDLSEDKFQVLLQMLPIYIKEIIGSMYYQLTEQKYLEFNGHQIDLGFQLSDSHLRAIQEDIINKLGLNPLIARTSLQYLKKAILNKLGLQEVNYINRSRNWLHGSCKSYKIFSENDIEQLVLKLYRGTFANKISKDFINEFTKEYINNLHNNCDIQLTKSFILNILYISLGGNAGVSECCINDPPNLLS